LQGKDDCVRKAHRNVDIAADLTRLCPALTLQQARPGSPLLTFNHVVC
jgi:hypothetical protein